ncbi:MAG: radical SAM protein [Deferrisomatales bacterium]
MIVTERMYPRRSERWHLRPEGGHGVLFHYDPEALVWYTLSREQTCAWLLMDGTRTLGELRTILEYLLDDLPTGAPKRLLEALFEKAGSAQNAEPFLTVSDRPEGHRAPAAPPLRQVLERMERTTVEEFRQVRRGRLTAPLNLTLMPSNACATDCVYCYSERVPLAPEEHMPLGRWLEVVEEAAELGVELAVFSGGDPFTYPHLLPLLEALLARGFAFVLPTKTYVSPERARALAAIGMGAVWTQVSLDGLSEEVLRPMMGVERYGQRAMATIDHLLGAGLQVRVNCVATPLNYREVPELVRALRRRGVGRMGVAGYGRSFYRHDDRLFLTAEQMGWLNEVVESLREELAWEGLTCSVGPRDFTDRSPEERARDWPERASCSGGRSSFVITPTGKVTLCEQMPVAEAYVAGDLTRQTIREIWNSQRLRDLMDPPRERFAGTPCETCEEYASCHQEYGYCFRDALFTYGTVYAPPPACPLAPPGVRMG